MRQGFLLLFVVAATTSATLAQDKPAIDPERVSGPSRTAGED